MRESRNKLTEKEMELARMLMSECNTTADVQSKLKRLFAGTIEQMLGQRWMSISVTRRIRSSEIIRATAATVMVKRLS